MDFAPGDLVQCVNVDAIKCPVMTHGGMSWVKGRVYRVSGFAVPRSDCGRVTCKCRAIVAENGKHGLAHRFRKLNDEPDNAELVERIKNCRPIRQGVSA